MKDFWIVQNNFILRMEFWFLQKEFNIDLHMLDVFPWYFFLGMSMP
jgi:hypothetical protein